MYGKHYYLVTNNHIVRPWLRLRVAVPAAGSFYLTANFTTYHMNQDLNVSVNGAESLKANLRVSMRNILP